MDADVIIIGAGASGLFAGVTAGKRGRRVLILEQKEKVGKKLLATGNGKCNFTNQSFLDGCYRGEDPSFAQKVLKGFDMRQTVGAFRKMGIEPKIKNGCYYPASEQAASVVEALRLELLHNKVRVLTGVRARRIQPGKQNFTVETCSDGGLDQTHPNSRNENAIKDAGKKYQAPSIVLSTGGCAYPTLGSDGSGYGMARSLGHRIVEPLPALTGLRVKEKSIRSLAGVRVEAGIRMQVDGEDRIGEKGELQLVKYGISGIPVFQISRFASKALQEGKNVTCLLDFFPHLSKEGLSDVLRYRLKENGYKAMGDFLVGLVHNKLAHAFVRESGIPLIRISSETSEAEWNRILSVMKGWKVTVTGPAGFDKAQVTAGGVATDEVNATTMESKLVKNLYLTGELVDIDGMCGGYNLQWAWTTGYLAGRNA